VRHEMTFDHFHEKKDSIYRVLTRQQPPENASETERFGVFFKPDLLEVFRANNPSVLRATRYQSTFWNWVEYDTKMRVDGIAYVDPDFLEMFSFKFLAGDKTTALSQPDGIVLTVDLVNFFFGEQHGDYSNILGKVITLPASKQKDFIIRGVMENVPDNSIFSFSALTPYKTWEGMGCSDDFYGSSHIFAEVDSQKNVSAIEHNMSASLMSFYERQIGIERTEGRLSNSDHCLSAYLQPLEDIYFNPSGPGVYLRRGNIWYSIILTGIASLILIIACINAVTIQLGQATMLSREVGIRKVIGAKQSQLVTQFFIEAGFLCAASVILAVILAELLLPSFNNLAQKHLELSFSDAGQMALFLFGAMAFITLVIGGFPSLIMSCFSPLKVLKFQKQTQGRTLFANGLVILQYGITIILFFSTFVMQRQIRYARDKDTGFEKEGVLVLSLPQEMTNERREVIRDRLKAMPSIMSVGGSDRNYNNGSSAGFVETPGGEHIPVRTIRIDEDYLDTLEIPVIEGKGFSGDMTSSRDNMILINRTMAERFGWDQPVGQLISFWGKQLEVMGMVEDFHIDSMRDQLSPLFLNMWSDFNGINYYFVRYKSGRVKECRAAIEKIWNEYEPNRLIELRFLDSILQEQYESEERWNRITIYASAIAIILSCMGLWGITALAVARRTKEIGIRKVLGSGEVGIWGLFSKDLLRLFVFSFVIAVPVATYAMQRWLDLFAYHIGIPWQAFAQAAAICLMLSMLTISWLVVRAAGNNPVESLRYE
jgi:putative ABC transport system permease protein